MTRTNNRALANTPHNYVSVLDFGAVGDGVTDDHQSIQDAISYAYSQQNANRVMPAVVFPDGTYKISKSIQIFRNLTLLGLSRDVEIICTGNVPVMHTSSFDGTTYTDNLDKTRTDIANKRGNCTNITIKDLFLISDEPIHGDAPSGSPLRATLQLNGCIGLRLERVRITNPFQKNHGIWTKNGWRIYMEQPYLNGVDKVRPNDDVADGESYGVYFDSFSNAATVIGGYAVKGWDIGYYVAGNQSVSFLECEAADSYIGWALSGESHLIKGGYTENLGTSVRFGSETGRPAFNCSVDGLYIGQNHGAPGGPIAAFELARANEGYIRNIMYQSQSDYTDVGKTLFNITASQRFDVQGLEVEHAQNTIYPLDLAELGLNGGNFLVKMVGKSNDARGQNLLSWYSTYTGNPIYTAPERSQFTPTFTPSGIQLGSKNKLRYTRNDSRVEITGSVSVDTNPNSTGQLTLTNLPYTIANLATGAADSVFTVELDPPVSGVSRAYGRINNNGSTEMKIFGISSVDGSRVDMGDVPAGTQIYISGMYITEPIT